VVKSTIKYIIGVDEVGRGPIAGPVAIGAFLIPRSLSWKDFKGLKDSKKLSEKVREEWFKKLNVLPKARFAVSFTSHTQIDRRGIVPAISSALTRSLKKLNVKPEECLILLDGGLRAPSEFINQKTIIKGDEKECAIACASIMAKVSRDRRMVTFARTYPKYGFEVHKGYGTKKHYEQISRLGACAIHRKSFLKG
jgi:ribonuclease HII